MTGLVHSGLSDSALSTSAQRLFAALALAGALHLPATGAAAAQAADGGGRCAGDGVRPFPPPAASPLEPRTRLSPVRIDRGERERWVGLVDVGDRFPFWLVRPGCPAAEDPTGVGERKSPRPGPALAASVAGGAFSRFDLESRQNDFIQVHYRVGLRLLARLGAVDARAELFHVSSHLGDEFLQRTGRDPISTSREGLEVLVAGRPVDGVRLYGGPGLVLRSSPGFDAGSLRAGLEWEPAVRWGAFRPYLGIEGFSWQELGWAPTATAEAGLRFGDRRYGLALTAGAGRSRAEQFFREDETLVGVTVSAEF